GSRQSAVSSQLDYANCRLPVAEQCASAPACRCLSVPPCESPCWVRACFASGPPGKAIDNAEDKVHGSVQECSSPLINCHMARLSGVGTPFFFPHSTIAPFMKSTSVWRLASTSCNMLALCLPGALAPFSTSARGSP